MEGTWHQIEYKQIAIPGSSNAQFSISFNNVEIFTKDSFETSTSRPSIGIVGLFQSMGSM